MRGQPARSLHTREPLGHNEIGRSDTAAIWRGGHIVPSDTHQRFDQLHEMPMGVKSTEGQEEAVGSWDR